MNLLQIIKDFLVIRSRASTCGHEYSRNFTIEAFGEKKNCRIKLGDNPPYCQDCLSKVSIRCAKCEKSIFAGDTICLSSLDGLDTITKDNAMHDGKYIICSDCGQKNSNLIWSIEIIKGEPTGVLVPCLH